MAKSIVRDKWLQYRILKESPILAGRLPQTWLLNRPVTLSEMLRRYQSVVLKPRDGRYGHQIRFIRTGKEAKVYHIHREKKTITAAGIRQLYNKLGSITRSSRYIIQIRLRLAQIQGRPFDIRIMVQRTKGAYSPWRVTGSYAKVAAKGYLITNVASRIIPVKAAMKEACIYDQGLSVKAERIAVLAAKRLGRRYPHLRQVGFDIGIDKKQRIWIIEGNYKPDLLPFMLLDNAAMNRRIQWYMTH
ncbi:YheC/YheD family protein [Paenibacillus sp. CF384]|uniref:YheC/YheD family protein n=1 Tax=Paenibacillus sp. CF384 TaxID=1884382 RepID=UPI00089790CC|nr:YheC/YheD family protein [Paenibacillus sp. CF384]SDX93017.1 YheC/D like ATP-grasp [Paenibacillus sp. CF384]